MNDEPIPVKVTGLPEKKLWEQQWISYALVVASILCSLAVAFMGWKINERITKSNIDASDKIATKNRDFSKLIHAEDADSKNRSDSLARSMAQSSIDQQKISWTVSLLPHLSSTDPKLQLYASLVLRDLKKKGVFPDHLVPAIAKAAFDTETNPDAARILKDLLGKGQGQYTVSVGSNLFVNVPFPLSLDEKRYFIINSDKGQFSISVIVGNEDIAEFEIVNNKPVRNSLSNAFLTDSQTLVVSNLNDGKQVYKIDIGREIDLTYLSPDKPVSIKVFTDKIQVGSNTLSNNSIQGFMVGIIVFKNGDLAMGGTRIAPRAVSELFRRALQMGNTH
ncbi:MAG: hypothetical protein CVU55_10820 [Deltaproteobacteria bacterium HGW-Deltaproteobacteria-13]|jgi:hypothetical protein|nr:MAG: hypothetical protein CVU55_10820 [Deltaproteobacteria bacterium HGW-Deltaproteobacteria-13]